MKPDSSLKRSHYTPTVIVCVLLGQGEFVVVAIPYPASATFTVSLWGGVQSPAASVAELDEENSYVYDAATGNLLLYMYQRWSEPESVFGLSQPGGWMEYQVRELVSPPNARGPPPPVLPGP